MFYTKNICFSQRQQPTEIVFMLLYFSTGKQTYRYIQVHTVMLKDGIPKVTLRRALCSSFKLGHMGLCPYMCSLFIEDFVLHLVSVAHELQHFPHHRADPHILLWYWLGKSNLFSLSAMTGIFSAYAFRWSWLPSIFSLTVCLNFPLLSSFLHFSCGYFCFLLSVLTFVTFGLCGDYYCSEGF